MKTKLLSIFTVAVLFASSVFAQTSDMGFSFQGYAIDPDGKSIGNEGVTVRFTITPGTFTEEHTLTTDAFGVFTAIVGNSSAAKNAEFAEIDFTKKNTVYSLQVEVKKTVGGTYTTISNAPMNAVPYARHAANGVPVGTVVVYAGDANNVPEGWLLCDGASVGQADYPQLYAILGSAWGTSGSSFNLPDLRGRFLRGVDDGAGVDPNASTRTASNTGGNTGDLVGTVQGDATARPNSNFTTNTTGNHSHDVSVNIVHSSTNGGGDGYGDLDHSSSGGYDWGHANQPPGTYSSGNHSHSITGGGDAETRPVNASVYYIIKY